MDCELVRKRVIILLFVAQYGRHITKCAHEDPRAFFNRDILVAPLIPFLRLFQGQAELCDRRNRTSWLEYAGR